MGHRVSDDIDIFVSGIALAELSPNRNPAAKAIHPYPQWPGHYLKFERDEGEIDFLSSALQTSPGFTLETFEGRTIALETPTEIMIKKISYRAAQFTPRDAFDVACVLEDQPEVVAAIARETADALPRLNTALDVIGRRGPEAIAAQVRPEPTHRHLMTDTVDRAKAGIVEAMALAADPMPREAAEAMRTIIQSITRFQPGSKRGQMRFDWDGITDDERNRRLAAIDARPIESDELMIERWRSTDPKAFARWDAAGRSPSVDANLKPGEKPGRSASARE